MAEKNTNDLQQELMGSPNLNAFLSENQEKFSVDSIADLLNRLFEKRELSKAALAKRSGMS